MAKPKAPTYSEKVYAHHRDMVEQLMGGTCVERDGVQEAIYNGVVASLLSIVDEKHLKREILLTPGAATKIADLGRFYQRGSREGFVSMIVGRDPTPPLEAALGQAEGTAARDAKELGVAVIVGAAARVSALLGEGTVAPPTQAGPKRLSSDGDSFVVMPESARAGWKPPADLFGADEGFFHARGSGRSAKKPVLVLGTPDDVYAFPRDDGALLVRVVSFDAADEAVLDRFHAEVRA